MISNLLSYDYYKQIITIIITIIVHKTNYSLLIEFNTEENTSTIIEMIIIFIIYFEGFIYANGTIVGLHSLYYSACLNKAV